MTRFSPASLSALLFLLLSVSACEAPLDKKRSDYAPADAAPSDAQTRARAHTELAAGYYELGNFGVALQEGAEALKADPNYAPAYNVLGLVYMDLREDRPAESNFQHALRLNPFDSDANNNYGWFLCQRKREQESVKYFLAALRNPLYQTPDKSWVNAGVCSRQAGDIAGAQSYFERALKARPDQPQALFNLADLAYQRSQYAQAKVYLSQLQRTVAPSPDLLWLALRTERKLGDRNAEESLSFQLTKNFPNSTQARALQAGQYE